MQNKTTIIGIIQLRNINVHMTSYRNGIRLVLVHCIEKGWGMVKEAVSGVASDQMLQPQVAAVQMQGEGSTTGDFVSDLREMLSDL